jgi:hypothetical protein
MCLYCCLAASNAHALCVHVCRYVWAASNEYDGEWRNGRMHGQGTVKWNTGEGGVRNVGFHIVACGPMSQLRVCVCVCLCGVVWCVFHRVGTCARQLLPCAEPALIGVGTRTCSGHRYDGEWREGLEDGIGVFTWRDGSTFEGFWRAVRCL